MSTCKQCGSPVIWAQTSTGKRMPLEARPDERYGSFLLVTFPDGKQHAVHQARATDEEKAVSYARYQSHFETCPNPRRPQ